jgi:hypothetical protein
MPTALVTGANRGLGVNNAGVGLDFGVPGVEPDFDAIQRTLET